MKINVSTSAIVLLLGTLCSRIGLFMSVPFLSIYLTNGLHFTPVQTGYIIGMNSLMVVFTSFFVNKLTKQIKVTHLIYVIPMIWGLIFLSFYFTTNFWFLMFLNGLNGCCYSIYESSSKYLLSLTTEETDKFTIFNFRYLAINLGGLFGPLLGMVINTNNRLTSYLWLGSIYLCIGFIHFLYFRKKSFESSKKVNHSPNMTRNFSFKTMKPFLLFLFGVSFSYFGYSQFTSTVSQYFTNSGYFSNGIEQYSLTMAICQLLVLVFQFLLLRYSSKFSAGKSLITSNLLFSVSLLLLLVADHRSGWFFMMFVYSLAEVLLGSHLDYTVDKLAPKKYKTTYFALTELIKIGSTLGPIVGAYLIRSFTFAASQKIFILLALITAFGSLILNHIRSRLI